MNGDGEAAWPAPASTVRETGIALLHEGDRVFHAPGSEAVLDRTGQPAVVEYHFPVEIEVRAADAPADWRQLAEQAVAGLTDTLRSV